MSKQGNTLHAFDFLKLKKKEVPTRVVAFGDDAFLKGLVLDAICRSLLGDEDNDINLVKMSGPQAGLNDISDELHTISLFGGGRPRVVLIDDADAFVADCRKPDDKSKKKNDKAKKLEALLEADDQSGVLILDVGSWASNTRLYKIVDKSGLQIDCRAPLRGKSVDTGKIAKWASAWGKSQYGIKIQAVVIEHMLDITGIEMGILDQNLAKLSLYFDDKTEITEDAIDEYIGGWQTKTIWQVINSMISGQTGTALSQLNRLLQAGEVPQSLFGQIGWAIRRYAMAFDEAQRYRRHGKRMNVDSVISQAGFRPYEKDQVVEQLGKIGREKGTEYYRMLLDCDLAMKSSHAGPARARIALERLVLSLLDKKTGAR